MQIDAGADPFDQVISYAPNDFLFELVTALSLAMQGVGGEALAFCEPELFVFSFACVADSDDLHLQIVHYPGGQRRAGFGSKLLSMQASRRDIVVPFWRALRRLQGSMTPAAYRAAMNRDFPSDCMERLSQILAKEDI